MVGLKTGRLISLQLLCEVSWGGALNLLSHSISRGPAGGKTKDYLAFVLNCQAFVSSREGEEVGHLYYLIKVSLLICLLTRGSVQLLVSLRCDQSCCLKQERPPWSLTLSFFCSCHPPQAWHPHRAQALLCLLQKSAFSPPKPPPPPSRPKLPKFSLREKVIKRAGYLVFGGR